MNKMNEDVLIMILEYAITKEMDHLMCVKRAWKKACENHIVQCQYKFLQVCMPLCLKHLENENYITVYNLLDDFIKIIIIMLKKTRKINSKRFGTKF